MASSACTYSKNWVSLSRLQLDQDHGLVSKPSDGAMRCWSLRLRVHLLLSPSWGRLKLRWQKKEKHHRVIRRQLRGEGGWCGDDDDDDEGAGGSRRGGEDGGEGWVGGIEREGRRRVSFAGRTRYHAVSYCFCGIISVVWIPQLWIPFLLQT